MVLEIQLIREGEHSAEYLVSERPVHDRECIFLPDKRTGVKAYIRQAHFGEMAD